MRIYVAIVIGIALSMLLPPLAQSVKRSFQPGGAAPATAPPTGWALWVRRIGRFGRIAWPIFKPYLVLAVFSCLTALLLMALLGESLTNDRAALLAGYAWDSTLQKLKGA